LLNFAHFAAKIIFVRQEDGTRDLLGDGRGALQPLVGAAVHEGQLDRAGQADRIDADMRAEASVFDRHHRIAHHRRNLVVRQPLAIARPDRHDHRAVGGMDPNHLAVGR
jgi:hypothetical protein